MIDLRKTLKSATDRQQWATRGASFVAKAKATKAVWFPPEPVETGKKAGSTATKSTKKTTRSASKKTAGSGKKATGSAKKATGGAKKASGSAGS